MVASTTSEAVNRASRPKVKRFCRRPDRWLIAHSVPRHCAISRKQTPYAAAVEATAQNQSGPGLLTYSAVRRCQRSDRSGIATVPSPRMVAPAMMPPCRRPGFRLISMFSFSAAAEIAQLVSRPAW